MKKLSLLGISATLSLSSLWVVTPSYAEATYVCHRYYKGKPQGSELKVKANSKEEASIKALARFKKNGGKVDSAKCRV